MDWHNILERAAWTAVQGFIGGISITAVITASQSLDYNALQQIAIAGGGSALAALASFLKTVAQEKLARLNA